jgi:hypothetical protein
MSVNILERSVAYVVNVSTLGIKRKVRTDKVEVTDNAGEHPDESVVAVQKKILESRELDAVKSLDRKMHDQLERLALPSPLHNGTYLIPTLLIDRVDKLIEDYKVQRESAIDKFIGAYSNCVNEASQKLNGLFEVTDYPTTSAVRKKFNVESQFVSFNVPSNGLDAVLYSREQAAFQKKMQDAAEEIQLMLRSTMKGMVDHLVEILTPGPDGKYKKIYETSVSKLMEFLKDFSARNITDDSQLESLVKQAEQVLTGVDVKALRDNDAFKQGLKQSLDSVKENLNGLVTSTRRAFDFDD